MAVIPHRAKRKQAAMPERRVDESFALWGRCITGQDYRSWRQEKMEAGIWRYDGDQSAK